MATGPHSTGRSQNQPGSTGQGEGAYFDGEGRALFKKRTEDPNIQEAAAVADDLIGGLLGGGNGTAPATPGTPGASGGGAAGPSASGADPEGTAGASGTSRGSASSAPGAGRMG